jgi:hypothetical protein
MAPHSHFWVVQRLIPSLIIRPYTPLQAARETKKKTSQSLKRAINVRAATCRAVFIAALYKSKTVFVGKHHSRKSDSRAPRYPDEGGQHHDPIALPPVSRLGEPQSQSGRCRRKKHLLTGINRSRPAHKVVTIRTEISQLQLQHPVDLCLPSTSNTPEYQL